MVRDQYSGRLVESPCPIIDSYEVDFVRLQDTDGLLTIEHMLVRFTREVHWMRESKTTMSIFDYDELSKDYAHNDYYGLLTSYEDLLESGKALVRDCKLTPDSTREVRVTVEISERPLVEVPHGFFQSHELLGRDRRPYFIIPDDWALDDYNAAKRVELLNSMRPTEDDQKAEDYWKKMFSDEYSLNRLETRITPIIIFSSNNTEEENASSLARLDAYRVEK